MSARAALPAAPGVTLRWRDRSPARVIAGEWGQVLGIAIQVGALTLLARALRIENPAFFGRVMPLVAVAFVAHHALPARWRLGAFALLSVASVFVVFGLDGAPWLVGAGLGLIAICHLPLGYWWRVCLLVAAGAVLAAMRAGAWSTPWPAAIWPILGSMFMYRLVAYMYDLRHRQGGTTPARAIAYFFSVPNVVFPLFPVVDSATFGRTYYDRPAPEIYQQGVAWIARGFTHLVAYRVVYQHLALSPSEVASTADLVRYLLANFALYLRVSGQFHLIVGVLHLFGFRLPETHRFFYLASSFTDFWRRINIYWKDFMQKVVFNPTFYGLRRRGETVALVVGTLAVFAATWFFHSYQWFWILGTWLMSWTDAAFWAILGVILVFGSVRELRRGRPRAIGTRRLTGREAIGLAGRTTLTFTVICVLWGLWTSPTFGEFFALFRQLTLRPVDAAAVLAVPLVIGAAAVAAAHWRRGVAAPARWGRVSLSMLPLAGVWALTEEPMVSRLGPAVAEVVQATRNPDLSGRDADQLQRGYYERLVGVNRFNGQLWDVFARAGGTPDRGPLRAIDGTGLVRERDDALQVELIPDLRTTVNGAVFTTNRWGMRDRDYDTTAAPGTWRMAVLGQSYVAGLGVADGESFESLVESSLASASPGGASRSELLNFAVPGYSLIQQVALLESGRVKTFGPRVLLLVGHPIDLLFTTRWVEFEVVAGRRIPYDLPAQRARAAGLTRDMSLGEMGTRLRPWREDLARWAMARLVTTARDQGMVPVYAFIPTPSVRFGASDAALLLRLAKEAGFEVIDLSAAYQGRDPAGLILSEADRHPNTEGHRVIAGALHAALLERPWLLGAPR